MKRYNDSLIGGMTYNERMVFLTNLILGFDTGYYFERFGLAMSYIPFNISGASNRYNNSMKEAINICKDLYKINKNDLYDASLNIKKII